MEHKGQNRWYFDGYRARMNGKPRSVNPKAQKEFAYQIKWNNKAKLWDKGWLEADEVNGLRDQWDAEIDAMREIS